MKQETQFSLFRALTTSKPSGTVTLAEVHRLITTDATLKENTEKFRYFKQQGFDADADKIKRSRCLAFTPAVLFDGNRGKKNIVAYTQYSLVDIDGNRRWLPFEVENILSPYDHPLPYEGLYSQVMHLWQSGFAYWFDQEEIRSLAKHVSRFEAPNVEEDQIRKHFRIPNPGEAYEVYSVADVLSVINMELKVQLSATKVGMLLNKLGFKSVRTYKYRGYKVCRYNLEEISNNRKEKVNDAEGQSLPF